MPHETEYMYGGKWYDLERSVLMGKASNIRTLGSVDALAHVAR